MNLNRYRTWLFDCDGVLLDSNEIKTRAFSVLAEPFGQKAVTDFVEFHQSNGGMSRFKKIEYLLRKFSKAEDFESSIQGKLDQFAKIVHEQLLACPLNEGMLEFLQRPGDENKKNFVVSGGLQSELVDVFQARGLSPYFQGIFGSPATKTEIIRQIADSGDLIQPAVFIGDSRLDYEVANEYGLDFIFMTRLSEFRNWETYFNGKDIKICRDFNDLL